MNIISCANNAALKILMNLNKQDYADRWMKYCIITTVDDGYLVYNVLTRELVFLSQDEYDSYLSNSYLRDHWFVVPESFNDKEVVDLIRQFSFGRHKNFDPISGYTIYTTTDCNARCFYCFELGYSRVHMTTETAYKVVDYIRRHSDGNSVSLKWFGGEPLYNIEPIRIICRELRDLGLVFDSQMISNGYLFDEDVIQEALSCWNLQKVQITLDGTEKIYNKTKAFIYSNTNPYQIVLCNIGKLITAGISVSVRLNVDMYNSDDLLVLVDELSRRYSGNKKLKIYAHHLFKSGVPIGDLHSDEEWLARGIAMRKLEDKIENAGFAYHKGISKDLKLFHCMADCGSAVTILPNGDVGLCEHCLESDFIGHVDHDNIDMNVVNKWRKLLPIIPECEDCKMYPSCIRLEKCTNRSVCYHEYRVDYLNKTKKKMINSYNKWLKRNETLAH